MASLLWLKPSNIVVVVITMMIYALAGLSMWRCTRVVVVAIVVPSVAVVVTTIATMILTTLTFVVIILIVLLMLLSLSLGHSLKVWMLLPTTTFRVVWSRAVLTNKLTSLAIAAAMLLIPNVRYQGWFTCCLRCVELSIGVAVEHRRRCGN